MTGIIDPGGDLSEVILLKSEVGTATNGFGEPVFDVKLLILKGGRIINDYGTPRVGSTERDRPGFYMDDYLQIRDVINDGTPEILFHSGFQGVSDSTTFEHILRYDKSRVSFVDLSPSEFYNSGTHGLAWLKVARRTFVVIADRNWSTTVPAELRCHYCPSPFKYEVYQWSNKGRSFVVSHRLYGKKSYEDADQALKGDLVFIQSRINH